MLPHYGHLCEQLIGLSCQAFPYSLHQRNFKAVKLGFGVQTAVVSIGYTDGSSAQLPASIVATDAQHDLAVLRVDATPELVQPIKASSYLRPLQSKASRCALAVTMPLLVVGGCWIS